MAISDEAVRNVHSQLELFEEGVRKESAFYDKGGVLTSRSKPTGCFTGCVTVIWRRILGYRSLSTDQVAERIYKLIHDNQAFFIDNVSDRGRLCVAVTTLKNEVTGRVLKESLGKVLEILNPSEESGSTSSALPVRNASYGTFVHPEAAAIPADSPPAQETAPLLRSNRESTVAQAAEAPPQKPKCDPVKGNEVTGRDITSVFIPLFVPKKGQKKEKLWNGRMAEIAVKMEREQVARGEVEKREAEEAAGELGKRWQKPVKEVLAT